MSLIEKTDPSGPLSQEQVAFFDREGYLAIENLVSDEDLAPVIGELEEAVDCAAREEYEAGHLENLHENEPFPRRLARLSEETTYPLRCVQGGQLAGAAFLRLIRHPNLLDLAEQFCGPEIIASSVYRVRPKVPNWEGGEVPWHQDAGYTEPFCDDALMLTLWMPLVDAHEENGCLWVIPRAHKGRVIEHAKREGRPYLKIPSQELPTQEAVPCPVPKGGALLMTNRTPHASFANRSDHVRWSMDLRYQSAHLPTSAPITRLEDEIEGGDGEVPPACFPPEADFLVRSKARPDEVVADPETFFRIRKEYEKKQASPRWNHVIDE
jgi:hypothetical protein